MDSMPTRNRALVKVLQEMLSARERAGTWLEGDAEFDPESQRLMGVMNDGDRKSVAAFVTWVESIEDELPITVSSPDGGRHWTLDVDAQACEALPQRDRDMLDTMAYMLFNGPEPGPGNTVADELMGLGLPDKLRRDLSGS